jgi:hypothetical protein
LLLEADTFSKTGFDIIVAEGKQDFFKRKSEAV